MKCIKNALVYRAGKFERTNIYFDSKIKEISKRDFGCDEEIDAQNCVVLPAFHNAHSHIAMSFARGFEALDLQDWLKKIWEIESKLDSKILEILYKIGLNELITFGCGSTIDSYFEENLLVKLAEKANIKIGTGHLLLWDNVEEVMKEQRKLKSNDHFTPFVTIHSLYTNSKESVEEVVSLAKELGQPIQIHLCENERERKEVETKYGMQFEKIVNGLGLNSKNVVAAHMVHWKGKFSGLVAHCPSSNLKLRSGILNYNNFENIALGSDGQGSNDSLNLMEEARLAGLLSSFSRSRADVFEFLFESGRWFFNSGVLEVGKDADFVILKPKLPVSSLRGSLLFAPSVFSVEKLFVRGRESVKFEISPEEMKELQEVF